MPELPEVETVRRGLERHLVGRRITSVDVGRERTVRRTSREALVAGLTDTVVDAAGRRGKYLLLPLDSGDTMMIHLRMSGQVLLAAAGASFENVVMMRSYFVHLSRDLPAYRKVRKEYLKKPYPASSAIGTTELAIPGLDIEIEAVAIL